jgi:hypothetical protein
MRRGAKVVREDRVLAVFALTGVAAVAPVEAARVLQAPVPAAGRLEEIAADRAHVAELGGGCEPARLAKRLGNPRFVLELGECRTGADAVAADAARDDPPDVDEPVGVEDPVPQERYDFGPTGK